MDRSSISYDLTPTQCVSFLVAASQFLREFKQPRLSLGNSFLIGFHKRDSLSLGNGELVVGRGNGWLAPQRLRWPSDAKQDAGRGQRWGAREHQIVAERNLSAAASRNEKLDCQCADHSVCPLDL